MIRPTGKVLALAALAAAAAYAQVSVSCAPPSLPQLVGTKVSVTCTASGGQSPYTWSISGTVPPGLSLDAGGNITGTLADPAGDYDFIVTATDSTPGTPQTGSQEYSGATVDPPVTVNCTLATGPVEVGVLYTNSCTASGGAPPYTWSIVPGAIVPPGLSITPTGNPATISYAPGTSLALYQYFVAATDSGTTPQTKKVEFTGAIAPAVTISTSSPLPAGVVGSAYSQQFSLTGGVAPYSWSATGLSGTGLSMNAAGLLAGTPVAPGPINLTVTLTDGAGGISSGPFTLTVNSALTITTTSPLPAAVIGAPYSETLVATGGSGGYSWSITIGSLPAGLSLSTGGIISGTTSQAAFNSSFTASVTDSSNASVSAPFTIAVPLTIITSSPLPAAAIGTQYNQTLVAGGGEKGGYTWTAVTSLPSWLPLTTGGVLLGTPPSSATNFNFKVKVTDTASASVTSSVLTLPVTLSITTSSPLPGGTVKAGYSQTLTGQGGLPPYTWSLATGSSLPAGLTLNATTGLISGPPTTAGTFSFTIQLSDSAVPAAIATSQFAVTISGPLTITTTSLPNATVGFPYSQTVAAAGGAGPYTWAITAGALPLPLSLNTATGAITGTPTATGAATFTVTVKDSASVTANRAFTLTTVAPPVITTASLPNGTAGVAYSQTLAASGGTPPYTWAISSGGLPNGLSLSTAGAITGNPIAGGTANFTVRLTDSTGVAVNKVFTLTIVASVTISTTSPLPSGELGIAYSKALAATGGATPYTWSVTAGLIPAGLTLAASGAITGTPSAAGTFNFTAQVSDSNHATASTPFTLTIAGLLSIATPTALNGGSAGSVYSQSLAASGGVTPYTWNVTAGSLPEGLALSSAGAITGIPTTTGTVTFTARVVDAVGATASRQFTIVIATGLTVSSPAVLPTATVGTAYTYALQASGGTTPYTWTIIVGSAPPGLSVKQNGGFNGIPSATGTFTFTAQVLDGAGHQASEALSLTVVSALSITTATLPGGTVGAAYAQTMTATGGTPPYSWSIAAGALPGGLAFSATGAITGTIGAAGTFTFTAQVTDSLSVVALKQLQIVVAGGLTVSTAAALPGASINVSYSQTLAAAGGTSPYTWAVTGGALPGGLILSSDGAISGTPTAGGTFHFTATVTDSANATASQQFTLIVVSGLTFTTTTLANGKAGTSYGQVLAAIGGTSPYTFTKSAGTLPPGITLTGATLGGTPTIPGSYTFTIQVTDSVSATATEEFTIVIDGLVITTASLPSAAVGTAYSQAVAAKDEPPSSLTWAITKGTLPVGLSLNSTTGIISGTPGAAGSFNVTVQVTDSTKATASAALTLNVISGSFSGLSGTATAAQQVSGTLALGAAYPSAITGQVTLSFQPDASLASPADDPSIQFSGGGRTANFTIPANSTAPVSFSLQTGTVAGAITLGVTWQSGGATLPSPAALTQAIQIAPAVPGISAVTASTTSSGFQVVITGYSTTREVSQAALQFTAAAGQTLQTTSLTVPLSNASTTWFQSSSSDQYGSQFILTLPFNVSNGTANAIGSIAVQLVNSQGTSASASATF